MSGYPLRVARPSAAHLPTLDGVRGVAVLVVIVHNSAWIAGESEQVILKVIGAFTAAGWIGVQLFFALSGFLIGGILLDAKGKKGYFRSFYLRRTLRIFPLYYSFIALAFFVGPLVAWSPDWVESVRRNQWSYWLYLSNWVQPFKRSIFGMTHLWSLAVEEQFYMVWPLVVRVLSSRGLIAACAFLILGTPFIRFGIRTAELPQSAAYLFTIARWDALAAGALVAALMRSDSGRMLLERWTAHVTLAAGVFFALLVVKQRGFHSDDLPVQVIGQSLVALLSACLIVFAVSEGPRVLSRVQSVLSFGGLRTLGKYSYAMYVFHFPIHHSIEPAFIGFVTADDSPLRALRLGAYLLLVIGLSFVAAQISWRLVEKPFLDLKDRIAPRST